MSLQWMCAGDGASSCEATPVADPGGLPPQIVGPSGPIS